MQLLGGKKCIFVCLTTKSVQIWHRIDLGIFARPLAKTRQVAGSALKNEREVHDIYDNCCQLRRQLMTIIFLKQEYAIKMAT